MAATRTAPAIVGRVFLPPTRWQDYLSLAKPRITFLIVLVAVAGFVLAEPGRVNLVILAVLIACGTSASAGAAMLNHFLDRDVDARMRRTKHRPLPDERIAPTSRVAVLGLFLSGLGVGVAVWAINPLTGVAILSGGATYVLVYTLWLKRRSSWNIVIGGFAGSAPALAGSAAAVGHFTPGVLAFAFLVFLWTPPHFWSLALLLREDYLQAELPMLPRMDDPNYSGKIVVFSTVLLLPATLLVGILAWFPWAVLGALLVLAATFVVLTAPLWTKVNLRVARRSFIYSGVYLVLVIAVVAVHSALVGFHIAGG
jgi:protoheme IX farnesyltransferase